LVCFRVSGCRVRVSVFSGWMIVRCVSCVACGLPLVVAGFGLSWCWVSGTATLSCVLGAGVLCAGRGVVLRVVCGVPGVV
jgi:hypothetical protein